MHPCGDCDRLPVTSFILLEKVAEEQGRGLYRLECSQRDMEHTVVSHYKQAYIHTITTIRRRDVDKV